MTSCTNTFSAATVACIVKVDRESLKVLDQNGSIRTVLPTQVTNKVTPRRDAVATDRNGAEVRHGDTVREMYGEQRNGVVLHIHRSFLFLHNKTQAENAGIIVVRTSNILTVSAKGGRSGGPDLSKMNPALMKNNMGGGSAMPPPKSFGRDRMLGKTVLVRKGPFKGLVGIVKDSTDLQARVELHSKSKIVTIPKELLVVKEYVLPRYLHFKLRLLIICIALLLARPLISLVVREVSASPWVRLLQHHQLAGVVDVLLWRLPILPGHLPGEDHRLQEVSFKIIVLFIILIDMLTSITAPAWGGPSGSRTPAWKMDGSRTSNPYDGSRTAYGGFGGRTPAWNAGARTPYDSGSGLSGFDAFAAGSRTPAWGASTAGNRTPAWAATGSGSKDHYDAPTPGGNYSAPTPGAYAAPTPGASAPTPGGWADTAPTPGAFNAPTPGGAAATPGVYGDGDDGGPRYDEGTPSP